MEDIWYILKNLYWCDTCEQSAILSVVAMWVATISLIVRIITL